MRFLHFYLSTGTESLFLILINAIKHKIAEGIPTSKLEIIPLKLNPYREDKNKERIEVIR